MKKYHYAFLVFVIYIGCKPVKNVTELESREVKVMTYNIRYGAAKEKKDINNWVNRKFYLLDQLKKYDADILGLQEVMNDQLKLISEELPGYKFEVAKRNIKGVVSSSPVFYKYDKFKLVNGGTFWLSETPLKMSVGWDASEERICTYALLQHKQTKEKLYVFNTHFDHKGRKAQIESAYLMDKKIKEINTKGYPVLLLGDLNVRHYNEAYKFLSSNYRDATKVNPETNLGPKGTFNWFDATRSHPYQIDYIFLSDNVEIQRYEVIEDEYELTYPSDHFPILVTLKL